MHRLLIQVRSYTGLGLVRAILVGFGGLGDVQGGEVHMRARIQGAGPVCLTETGANNSLAGACV